MSQRSFDVVESEPMHSINTFFFWNADYQHNQMYGAREYHLRLTGTVSRAD